MRRMLMVAAAGAVSLAVQASSAADLYDRTSRPLGAAELADIYSGKTWQWEAGAGYFGPGGHFKGWSSNDAGTLGYGIGGWSAVDDGRLCIEAAWHYGGEEAEISECFGHRQADGAVYQRVEPAGEWYVFRSQPPRPDDEANRITPGDEVTSRIEEIRSQ
jgi:hypothetical protein